MTDQPKLDPAESRRILAAATEGPWRKEIYGTKIVHGYQTIVEMPASVFRCTRPEDASFIIHARTVLPLALDEIEAKDREIARLREAVEFYADPDTYHIDILGICGLSDDEDAEGFGHRARAALTPEASDE